MDATAGTQNATRIACSRCGTSNAATARFCSSCGAALREAQSAPPPPPPPPENRFGNLGSRFGGGFGGGSLDNQTMVQADPPEAYQRAVAALRSAGAEIKWQAPPQNAQFTIGKKENGVVLRYQGALSVSPVSRGQSALRIDLKTDWGSVIPAIIGTIVLIFIVAWFIFPLLLAFAMPLSVLMAIYVAWHAASYTPNKLIEDTFKRIGGGSFMVDEPQPEPKRSGWGGLGGLFGKKSRSDHSAAAGGLFSRGADGGAGMGPPSAGGPTPATPRREAGAAEILEQIRQLATFRDQGLITSEEFDAKKAELLGRL